LRISLLVPLVLLAGCTTFTKTIEDKTKLEGPIRGDLGRELAVSIRNADPDLTDQLVDALAQDLEGGDRDLFDEVYKVSPAEAAAIGTGTRVARLDLELQEAQAEVVHDFWHQRDGYVVRYELDALLLDRAGNRVLSGPVYGIGFDDVTDPANMNERKRQDIKAGARRDVAMKISRVLSKAAEGQASAALAGLTRIHLPAGVGPVPLATLGFDDDPAARRRRGVQLTRSVASALQRLGPDLAVVSPEEVEQELGADPESRPSSFEHLTETQLDHMVPRLGARLYVMGTVSADGNRVEANAVVRNSRLEEIGTAKASAEGPGALALVAVEIARQLGAAIEKKPPSALPKHEENE
jgi:hypothetical protein